MQSQVKARKMKMDETEEQVSDIEDQIMENNETDKKREIKVMDHEGRLREVSDLLKRNNVCIMGVPEDGEKKR